MFDSCEAPSFGGWRFAFRGAAANTPKPEMEYCCKPDESLPLRPMVKAFAAIIDKVILFFYPPFRRMMNQQTFTYAACGGFNTLMDIGLFFFSYNFVFHKQVVDLGFFAFKPHIAAFLFAFCFSFPSGFFLSKFVVWKESNLRGRIQLFRYFVIVLSNILLNYVGLKLLIEVGGIYPTVAKIMITVVAIIFSYLSQKYYSFKVK